MWGRIGDREEGIRTGEWGAVEEGFRVIRGEEEEGEREIEEGVGYIYNGSGSAHRERRTD